jgi:hypothetical protein
MGELLAGVFLGHIEIGSGGVANVAAFTEFRIGLRNRVG